MGTNKSIFRRFLSITMAIILVSFILLGTMMMVFFSQYWNDEKKSLLQSNAVSVASIAGGALSAKHNSSQPLEIAKEKMLEVIITNTASNIDADVFVTDTEGNILHGSFHNSRTVNKESIDKDVVLEAMGGKYSAKSKLSDFYRTDYFIVGVPLTNSESPPQTVGAVFAATSASPMNSFQEKTMEIFLIASLLVLIIAFVVASFFLYTFVRPIREMNNVVQSFGGGDMSARMKVESDDEIGRLAVSFNEMANTLSNSESVRRSFIANISHELKTPMTTIGGFIDGILDGTIPAESQKRYLGIVSDEVKRLSRLVKSMLDLSKIDGGELSLSPVDFDITATVVKTVISFSLSIEEKEIEIRGLENAKKEIVHGDEDLLHQVVYNLIENAVKFTPKGGYISFAISSGIDRVSVAITNSGDGVESDELALIFERFYKTDKSRSKDKKGMGLGLYLVKTILKLHGGDIMASSVLGEYTRFEFYIPKEVAKKNTEKIIIPEEHIYDAEIAEIVDFKDVTDETESGLEDELENGQENGQENEKEISDFPEGKSGEKIDDKENEQEDI